MLILNIGTFILESVVVAYICGLYDSAYFEMIIAANFHDFIDNITCLVFQEPIMYFDFFLYDIEIFDDDFSAVCYDLRVGMHDASFPETHLSLNCRLLTFYIRDLNLHSFLLLRLR